MMQQQLENREMQQNMAKLMQHIAAGNMALAPPEQKS